MPTDIAEAYGLVVTPAYDERRSVALATEVAAHYLANLHERLGAWDLAVTAFGIGYERTLRTASDQQPSSSAVADVPAAGLAYLRAVAAVATALANPNHLGSTANRMPRRRPAIWRSPPALRSASSPARPAPPSSAFMS